MPRLRFWPAVVVLLAAGVAGGAIGGVGVAHHSLSVSAETLPVVPEVDVDSVFLDTRAVEVITTASWIKVPIITTRQAVKADHTLWRRMHFEDWDKLPRELMEAGLANLLKRYGAIIDDSLAWTRMEPADWDPIPQPARAMAFLNIIKYWDDRYQVGRGYGLDRRLVTDTLQAVAMAESWFEHRAINVNVDGSRDIGLPGASDYARDAIRRFHADGLIDFALTDDEYYDPFKAARMLTVWFQIMLDEADGDLDLAIRAYNRGIARALRSEGQEYLESVKRRRGRFIRNEGTSRAWCFLNEPRREAKLAADTPDPEANADGSESSRASD
ncbi:MAG: transglycosylase SLT domain-containing protein [Longimicrobiales bacterium]